MSEDAELLVIKQVDDWGIVWVDDLRADDALTSIFCLLTFDQTIYEELLKPLICEVDADLERRGEDSISISRHKSDS